jgi:hypothetical protein
VYTWNTQQSVVGTASSPRKTKEIPPFQMDSRDNKTVTYKRPYITDTQQKRDEKM